MIPLLRPSARVGTRFLVERCSSTLSVWSPLAVIGEQKSSCVQVVKPDLALAGIGDVDRVQQDIEYRGWSAEKMQTLDFEMLARTPGYLEWMDKESQKFQEVKSKVNKDISAAQQLLRNAKKGSTEAADIQTSIEKLYDDGRKLTGELKNIIADNDEIEQMVYTQYLSIPNALHPAVPREENTLLWRSGDLSAELASSNLDPLREVELPLFREGRVAELEIELYARWTSFRLSLEAAETLVPSRAMTGPDFVKSVVLAGCGVSWQDEHRELSIHDKGHEFCARSTGQGMHLAGGASLYGVVSFFIKNMVTKPKPLPQAFFVKGSRYKPASIQEGAINQTEAVQYMFFSCGDVNLQFESVADHLLRGFLQEFEIPTRLIEICAPQLGDEESRRICIQAWMPSSNCFVTVGHLAMYGDYISSRLMLKTLEPKEPMENLSCFGGEVFNASLLAQCLYENHECNVTHERE